jgi:uncharacterized protein (DUF2141 family)
MTRIRTALTTLAAVLALAGTAHAAPLTFTLDGVRDRPGTLFVSVQSEAEFMKNSGTAGQVVPAPKAGTHDFTFDVPPGRYAVTVWHDDNGNGVFDTGGPYNVPLDGWTMHNGLAIRGAPVFADVSLEVPAEGTALTLSMIYGR